MLLNFSKKFRLFPIDNSCTLFWLLPSSGFISELRNNQEEAEMGIKKLLVLLVVVPLTTSPPATYSKGRINVKLHVLQGTEHQLLQPLSVSLHQRFTEHFSERFWCRSLVISLYCCYTPEGRNMPSLKIGFSCLRFLTGKDNVAVQHDKTTRDPWKFESACIAS